MRLLGEADGRSREERKGQVKLYLEDHLIGLDLYSRSSGKPLIVPGRSQQEKICYEKTTYYMILTMQHFGKAQTTETVKRNQWFPGAGRAGGTNM